MDTIRYTELIDKIKEKIYNKEVPLTKEVWELTYLLEHLEQTYTIEDTKLLEHILTGLDIPFLKDLVFNYIEEINITQILRRPKDTKYICMFETIGCYNGKNDIILDLIVLSNIYHGRLENNTTIGG